MPVSAATTMAPSSGAEVSSRSGAKEKRSSLDIGLGKPFPALRVNSKVLMEFCLQLAMGMDAGLPLLKQMQVLAETEPNRKFREFLKRVTSRLVEGNGIAESLANEPSPFTSAQLAMIQAGAASGSKYLPKVFQKIRNNLENGLAIQREIKNAIRYPAIVGFIALVIIFGMLWSVVPQFGTIFKETGAKIPKLTQILLTLSSFLHGYWYLAIVGVVGTFTGVYLLFQLLRRQVFIQSMVLALPIIGPFMLAHMRCAFFQAISQLLAASVPLQKALVIVQKVHPYKHFEDTVRGFVQGVTSGRHLSDCMLDSDIFGKRAAQLVATGEKSSKLDEILEKSGGWLEVELLDKLRSVTKLFEPVAVIILAVLVGVMVASLFMPLFSMAMAFK